MGEGAGTHTLVKVPRTQTPVSPPGSDGNPTSAAPRSLGPPPTGPVTAVTFLHSVALGCKDALVIEACTNRREAKRLQTMLRLQHCAIRLTLDQGFDGWTIEDLAAAADVSRRTVFNYFEGKAEVVLGPEPEISDELLEAFVGGGPSGRLFDDLVVVAHEATREHELTELDLTQVRDAIINDPHLLRFVHERFELAAEQLGDLVRQREGADFPADRCRTILRLLMACFDDALERTTADPDRTFHEHFDASVADIRSALA
ncbi:TetR family transcriptional regulator [Nocardioides sp. J9]|nr:TetR family transcriptional regulator [Nocardioides sp. J9]